MTFTQENKRIKALHSYQMMDTDAEKQYNSIANLAAYICKKPMALINLIDENRLWVKAKVGTETCEIFKELSFCKYTIQTNDMLEIKDTLLDEQVKNNPVVTCIGGIRYYAGVPLINPEGYVLGAICVFDTKPGQIDEKQKQALKFLADEVIAHMETSKKNRELEHLLQQQKQFESIFNNSSELHCILNEEGKVEFINSSVEQILGYKAEEILGRSVLDFCTPDDQKFIETLRQSLEQRKDKVEFLTKIAAKDGTIRWISFYNVNLNNRWLSNGRDVTKQILAEQELKQLSLVASHINSGVVINDGDNNILWVNKAFENITGFSIAEVKGIKLRQILVGKDSDKKVVCYANQQANNKNDFYIEVLCYNKAKEVIWLSVVNSVIEDEQTEGRKSVEIIKDITERKKTELELQTLSFAVQKSAAGVLIRDGEEQVIWMNAALEEIFGWKLEELKGVVLTDQFIGEKTDLQEYKKAKQAVIEKKPYDIEIALYRKDGTMIWVSIYNNLLFDEEANISRQLSIMTDITVRKNAEQELIRTREEALQLGRAKEAFISVLSHEIRTPINAVMGMSRILLEENPAPHQVENLSILKFSSQNLLNLVNDILDFTKIETGNMQLELAPLSLKQLGKQTLHTLEFKLEGKYLKLVSAIDPAVPEYVLGDSTRLYQIMINLLGNAIKFTAHGEVKLAINVEKEEKETVTIRFSVSDTGIGIAANKLDTIFDAYAQATNDTTRKFGGTGLGLTITKKLVELHQSAIKVKSILGQGSEFSFTVCFKKLIFDTKKPITAVELDLISASVLVADDNEINRILAKKLLVKWGIDTDLAANGLEAYEMALKKDYDLILMDMHMPVVNGLEATLKIREQPAEKYKTIPIIALTGSVLGTDLGDLHEYGLTDHFLKPYTPEGLYNKIKLHLKQAVSVSE